MKKQSQLLFLREALASREGEIILNECRRFMIELSARLNSDAQWVKGIGMLLKHLDNTEEECDTFLQQQ
ncbi:MAG: hypothetical protein IJ689_07500 [Alphaproteobacteria bacterium]|nr:hypothetical protein [Alphaproteobacteria bacterium]